MAAFPSPGPDGDDRDDIGVTVVVETRRSSIPPATGESLALLAGRGIVRRYGVPLSSILFVQAGGLPTTTSGKVSVRYTEDLSLTIAHECA